MKFKIKTIITTIILLIAVMAFYVILGGTNCPRSTDLKDVHMPGFVYYVWPLPESKISSICYLKSSNNTSLQIQERGISVELHPISIIDLEFFQRGNNSDQPFKERVALYVDGALVSNSSRVVYEDLVGIEVMRDGETYLIPDLSTSYIFSWTPFLMPGNHVAKVLIDTESGNVLEYEWSFLVW